MRSYQIQNEINGLITFFYRFGFWHQGPAASPKEQCIKLFYCIFQFQFAISLIGGAITNDSTSESIFLVQISIIVMVLLVKLCFLIWKQKEIVDFLDRICTFRIRYDDDFERVDVKMFLKFVKIAIPITLVTIVSQCVLLPIISEEKYLFYEVGFPWNWRTNDVAYWAALVFVFFGNLVSIVAFLFSIIVWYLLLNCSLRYYVLGSELRKIGHEFYQKYGAKVPVQEKDKIYLQDLKESIDNHLKIKELVNELESFCFALFLIQFCTSGLCICTSVYCLIFDVTSNLMKRLCHIVILSYNISEIFMITFFGNEIMVSSGRLSYSLFESNFIGQSESVKKLMIIFAEYLKQPHQLRIGNLYPLTLETFIRVLNGAYSMFNILQNVVH